MEKSEIKILLAEDDKEIAQLIEKYLQLQGYIIDVCFDGIQAYNQFLKKEYHIAILDVMMPKMDGFKLLENIRKESNIPVLMLTAKTQEIDKLLGFKKGADDYITKPFSMNELLARIDSQLRRYMVLGNKIQNIANEILKFESIKIDISRVKVFKNNDEIILRAKEFEILTFLAKNEGKVFSKGQIFENVWNESFMEDDNTIMVHIRRLRQKIEDDPENPKHIQTVWGIGYKFES